LWFGVGGVLDERERVFPPKGDATHAVTAERIRDLVRRRAKDE
jgi:hypothetical protein